MSESIKARTNRAYEYVLTFSKSLEYYYDHQSLRGGMAATDAQAWSISMQAFQGPSFRLYAQAVHSWGRREKQPYWAGKMQ